MVAGGPLVIPKIVGDGEILQECPTSKTSDRCAFRTRHYGQTVWITKAHYDAEFGAQTRERPKLEFSVTFTQCEVSDKIQSR